MEILGMGMGEWLLLGIIILVVVGPKDMVTLARRASIWVRKFTHSNFWKSLRETEQELRAIPTELAREAGIEELKQARKDLEKEVGSILPGGAVSPSAWMPPAPIARSEFSDNSPSNNDTTPPASTP